MYLQIRTGDRRTKRDQKKKTRERGQRSSVQSIYSLTHSFPFHHLARSDEIIFILFSGQPRDEKKKKQNMTTRRERGSIVPGPRTAPNRPNATSRPDELPKTPLGPRWRSFINHFGTLAEIATRPAPTELATKTSMSVRMGLLKLQTVKSTKR